MNKKIIILLISAIIIVLGIVIMFYLIYTPHYTQSNKENVNKNGLDNIKITDVKLDVKDEIISYKAKVKNVSGKKYKIKNIKVIMQDEEGKKIVTVTNKINKTLKKNETIIISSQTKAQIGDKQIKKIAYKIN